MRRKKYNENYFNQIDTEDKAYFLGLIYADGCIQENLKTYRYQLSLKLHTKDSEILEKFIKCINGEMDVWYYNQKETCEVKLSGKELINDLNKLGLVPNKSLILKYPNIDTKLERHFLRGYFDGDGCIRINKDKRDGSERGDLRIVSGSVEMIEVINVRFRNLFSTNLNKPYGPKNKSYKYIGWAAMSDIEKIYHGFYDGADFFLRRKKRIFDDVIKTIENKQKYRKK